jgi:hypothetical protein
LIEYKVNDTNFFIRAIKSIASVMDETVFHFKEGIRAFGFDPSRICLFELVIGTSELDIISDGDEAVLICIPDVTKALSRLASSEDLTLILDDNRLIIKGKIGGRTKTFKLNVSGDDHPLDVSDILLNLELDSVFNISLADFMDMVKDGEMFSEVVQLKTENNTLKVDGYSGIGEFNSEIEMDITSEETCQYSIVFLNNMLKDLGGVEVTISFATNKPMMVYNKLSRDSYLKWFLAPRVEQDDEY